MLKKILLTGVLLWSAAIWADSAPPPGDLAVQNLAETNGVALACRYFEQTRRIKAAMIDRVPKERRYGMAFDHATNSGYMAFVQSRQPCPMPAGFMVQVNQHIEALYAAFRIAPGE